jgi:iron complex transport system substrate-binding protein
VTAATRRLLAVLALKLAAATAGAAAEPPERVVSINLCADQIALMIAAPGQLVSVSDWATRPEASNLAEAAARLAVNSGSAEEVFLLDPDLVLAGEFTSPVTVAMLRRLGLRVEIVPAAESLAAVSARIRQVGGLLGREAEAAALAADYEAALAAEAARAAGLGREAAAYHYPNNYTSGAGTLADDVMDAAGLDNAAAALGLSGAARLDLETLVMAEPFLIRTEHISGARTGRAYESAGHPALAALERDGRGATVAERWQVCGTPFVAQAVAALVEARRRSEGERE